MVHFQRRTVNVKHTAINAFLSLKLRLLFYVYFSVYLMYGIPPILDKAYSMLSWYDTPPGLVNLDRPTSFSSSSKDFGAFIVLFL